MKYRFISLAAAALCAVSCYEDYVGDYSQVGCGFANQTDVRTVVVGEGMKFSTGVALGGTIANERDRFANFEIDNDLVNGETYSALKSHTFAYIADLMKNVPSIEAMPSDMYTLKTETGKEGRVIIKAGSHLGIIEVAIDSAAFLADVNSRYPHYMIPIALCEGAGTALIEGRENTVIGVHYENMLFGNWNHGGVTKVTDLAGNDIETVDYPFAAPQAENKVWTLSTVEPFALTSNAVGSEFNGSAAQMKLTLGQDDKITIESVPGAKYSVEPDGESFFVRTKLLQDRKIVLNYKYTSDSKVYHATDTLYFRNRIRDGVNEWQDENSNHYE